MENYEPVMSFGKDAAEIYDDSREAMDRARSRPGRAGRWWSRAGAGRSAPVGWALPLAARGIAGLRLTRWDDWHREPFTSTGNVVSVSGR